MKFAVDQLNALTKCTLACHNGLSVPCFCTGSCVPQLVAALPTSWRFRISVPHGPVLEHLCISRCQGLHQVCVCVCVHACVAWWMHPACDNLRLWHK